MQSSDLVRGGGQIELAPDLTYPSDKLLDPSTNKQITALDATGGLTTALSLTGKFAISFLFFSVISNGQTLAIKLTIDGIVIWNDIGFTFSDAGGELALLGGPNTVGSGDKVMAETIICKETFLLEIQTSSDTSITFQFLARPIL